MQDNPLNHYLHPPYSFFLDIKSDTKFLLRNLYYSVYVNFVYVVVYHITYDSYYVWMCLFAKSSNGTIALSSMSQYFLLLSSVLDRRILILNSCKTENYTSSRIGNGLTTFFSQCSIKKNLICRPCLQRGVYWTSFTRIVYNRVETYSSGLFS